MSKTGNDFPVSQNFPLYPPVNYWPSPEQPTLRDQFAMAALQGILAADNNDGSMLDISIKCYQFADAMMKAREVER